VATYSADYLRRLSEAVNWAMMKNPRAFLSPHEVRTTTASIKGRLESLIVDADAASESQLPAFSPALS
jgi:hypothetical protein